MSSPPARRTLRIAIGHNIVGGYMKAVDAATAWRETGREHAEPAWRGARPTILAFWHGRIMLAPHCWARQGADRKLWALISRSKDGDLIAASVEATGISTIRGSTAKAGKDKGGMQALRDMVKVLRSGDSVAITPDGPKGPRMRVGMGTVQLAKLSGAPLAPMTWSCTHRLTLDSWDRFLMPFPGGRGVFMFGAPIFVARDADAAAMEAARLELETTLNAMTAAADGEMGLAPTLPAPAPALEPAEA